MEREGDKEQNQAHVLFDQLLQAKTCKDTVQDFQELCKCLDLDPTEYKDFYHKLKSCLNYWKAKALWAKLDKRASHPDYLQGQACAATKCLVVGAGPCGLRVAIELAFLGAKVIVVDKRDIFSRNNVLHLWPFTIHDLRALGAKKFYGKFCTGTLDHVSIRQLQLILLKIALIVGVEVHVNVEFQGFIEPSKHPDEGGKGWRAAVKPDTHQVSQFEFDVLISAGGGRFVPEGFKKKELRGKLAIGITANFINRHTAAEAKVEEISGVARIYNQKFFRNLYNKTGIDLENIVYYKDDTHYFIMTAKKDSLLKKGIILQDHQDIEQLLSESNTNQEALLQYAREAAAFSTHYQLPDMVFALNHRNKPDVDMFDFTCMYRSEYAAIVKERGGHRLLVGLVGDCLVEPFWPLGTGVARGFLAAFDTAWMVKSWARGNPPLNVLAERESLYQLLSQTSPDNTSKNVSLYSINPTTRYPNVILGAFKPQQVQHLYDKGSVKQSIPEAQPLQKGRKDSAGGYDGLLKWCRHHTARYKNVNVTDLTKSWKSGLALCALIHHFRPDLINFDKLDEKDIAGNNQKAFDVAEQELGISPIMTVSDMLAESEPDKLSMVMYLTQFYEVFKALPPPNEFKDDEEKNTTFTGTKSAILILNQLRKTATIPRKITKNIEPNDLKSKDQTSDVTEIKSKGELVGTVSPPHLHEVVHEKNSQKTYSVKVNQPQDTVQSQHSWLHSPQSKEVTNSSDKCYFCAKRVYVLERVSADGRFFHRGCFKCHHCGTTLRFGNYVFDEDDGHFYCMLHYSYHLSGYMQGSRPEATSIKLDSDSAQCAEKQHQSSVNTQQRKISKLHSDKELSNDLPSRSIRQSLPSSELKQDIEKQPSLSLEEKNMCHVCKQRVYVAERISVEEKSFHRTCFRCKYCNTALRLDNCAFHEENGNFYCKQHYLTYFVTSQKKKKEQSDDMKIEKNVKIAEHPVILNRSDDDKGLSDISINAKEVSELDSGQQITDELTRAAKLWEEAEMGGGDEANGEEAEEESSDEEEDLNTEALEEKYKMLTLNQQESPTWLKRTLERRAKTQEANRFHKAQMIQRLLEELEVKYKELEEEGVLLEKALRSTTEAGDSNRTSHMIDQWLQLVQEKNALIAEESELMITSRYLELEDRQSRLDQQLIRYSNMDDSKKTDYDRAKEERILKEKLEVVHMRDALITILEEQRLQEMNDEQQRQAARCKSKKPRVLSFHWI
ncbi:protein-methionine sulfoxide oxidase mical3a-like isoform X2 [Protopterus annectens]|uniref:protein-methionine sulfoxide oxidase mical3a-like isoform X2 n=1 Tax=Protopterus annectens TaxID=7888 RepID=UPI001CF984E8|nr:protein-methionine sulfoxide oxidase mical3a-like isoform X2 [Protopterus annectens]